MRTSLLTLLLCFTAAAAHAQFPRDPIRGASGKPNVMILMAGSMSTLIGPFTCRGSCHIELGRNCTDHHDRCDAYYKGETRLQLARRVLTGGYGWNVTGPGAAGIDGRIQETGVMDKYDVRWGLAYYDGMGTRFVLDPTTDNEAAQKAVIDFGHLPNDEALPQVSTNVLHQHNQSPFQLRSTASRRHLNSWMPVMRTLDAWAASGPALFNGSLENLPHYDRTKSSTGMMSRALQDVKKYWQRGVSPTQFTEPANTRRDVNNNNILSTGDSMFPAPPAGALNDAAVIDGDVDNVLNGGCRGNYTILLSDGHGGCGYRPVGSASASLKPAQAAAAIYNLGGAENKVFSITFGVAHWDNGSENDTTAGHHGNGQQSTCGDSVTYVMDSVADYGDDGRFGGNVIHAHDATDESGALLDLSNMYAAFDSIFSDILSVETVALSAPVVARDGRALILTELDLGACTSGSTCNMSRRAGLTYRTRSSPSHSFPITPDWDAGVLLSHRTIADRNLFTPYLSGGQEPTQLNCGTFATCPTKTLRTRTIPIPSGNPAGVVGGFDLHNIKKATLSFMRGSESSRFTNGVFRGDDTGDCTDNDLNGYVDNASCIEHRSRFNDLGNSRPVIVNAPTGLGAERGRWSKFLDTPVPRVGAGAGAPSAAPTVGTRDRVIYVSSNDGFLRAFVAGKTNDGTNYTPLSADCPSSGVSASPWCNGKELWGYSPGLTQRKWEAARGGHTFLNDGSPVVHDVLFTRNTDVAGDVCHQHSDSSCAGWEYRTVLIQGLGAGGPGYFALDVTNPYDPKPLWERELTSGASGRTRATSRPQVILTRKSVGGNVVPYYVAIMGGGENEGTAGAPKGSIIAVGLEDGATYYGSTKADSSFIASPICLDADRTQFVDTCYAVTEDGSVYKIRFDFIDGGISMMKFFSARDAISPTPTSLRVVTRVVATTDPNDDVLIYFGTGDPDVQGSSAQNYFIKIKDSDPAGALVPYSGALGATRASNLCPSASSAAFNAVGSGSGILRLPQGEHVVSDPLVAAGVVLFTTEVPAESSCSTPSSKLYGFDYLTCGDGLDTDGNGAPDATTEGLGAVSATSATIDRSTGKVLVATTGDTVASTDAELQPVVLPPPEPLWRKNERSK